MRNRIRPEPGLHLMLTVESHRPRLLYAARIPHASRRGLRAPLITPDAPRNLTTPGSEFAAYVVDGAGAVLDAFAWPELIDEYFDRRSDKYPDQLIGPSGSFDGGMRLWRFPLRPGSAFIYVIRAEAVRDGKTGPLVVHHAVAALFWICGTVPPPGHVPLPPPPPLPDLGPPPLPEPLPLPPQPIDLHPPIVRLNGEFLGDPVPVVSHGDPAHCFNIVVVGDGFSAGDMAKYDQRVRQLFCGPATLPEVGVYTPACAGASSGQGTCAGLRHMGPFLKVWDLVNVWSVRTTSVDSGITLRQCGYSGTSCAGFCAQDVPRRTFYGTAACYHKPYPGYVGTDNPVWVVEAAARAVRREFLHLIIVILNHDCYGGRAVPDQSMLFVTLEPAAPIDWTRIVAHECGHTIGHLAEERVVCKQKDDAPCQPNQATRAHVDAGTVWWTRLARAGEIDEAGRFRAQHHCGDPLTPTGQPMGVGPNNAYYAMLGVFWGCQNILGADDQLGCAQPQDPRGKDFYRPMAECRMRWPAMEFCAVCDYEIASRVMDVCAIW